MNKLKQTNASVHLNHARNQKQQESPLSLTTGAMVLQISRGLSKNGEVSMCNPQLLVSVKKVNTCMY